ncbi:hypothetical protein Hanom_Chr06g00541271 [Helianthus anomalus]
MPLKKLVKEWATLQEHNKEDFAKVQEKETRNAQLMGDVQSLMKRMHYNISRLVNVDAKELMILIPKEASHLEIPKIIRHQPSVIPASQTETTSMGPPPPISKEEIMKMYEASPKIISDLNVDFPQSGSRPTTSRDTVFSQDITL